MHNTVYEISDKPIPQKDWATVCSLPEWFFQTVCDSATDMAPFERDAGIQSLVRQLDSCTWDGKKLSLPPDLKEKYFRNEYTYFLAAAEALKETSYAEFSGITPAAAFDLALQGLSESYEDKFGPYVLAREDGTLSTFDSWLRRADTTKPLYFGGLINYHC